MRSINCRRLSGETVPDEWKGSIPGVTYKFGGSFIDTGMTVKVHVTTRNVKRRTYNVIGYLNGSIEPGKDVSYNLNYNTQVVTATQLLKIVCKIPINLQCVLCAFFM